MSPIAWAQAAITSRPLSEVFAIAAGVSAQAVATTMPAVPAAPDDETRKRKRAAKKRRYLANVRKRLDQLATLEGGTNRRTRRAALRGDTLASPPPVFEYDASCCAGKFFHTAGCPTQKGAV